MRSKEDSSNRIENRQGDLDIEKELEGLHVEVNTMNLCYDELKTLVEDLRKRDIRHHSHLSDLDDKHRKMQDEMRKGFDDLEKQLKIIQLNLLNSSNDKSNQLNVKTNEPEEMKSHSESHRSKSPSTVGSE